MSNDYSQYLPEDWKSQETAEANARMLGIPLEKENSNIISESTIVVSIPLRWRYITTAIGHPYGDFWYNVGSLSPKFPATSPIETGDWQVGGRAYPFNKFCNYQNFSGWFFGHIISKYIDKNGDWKTITTWSALKHTKKTIEIDWGYTLQGIRDAGYTADEYQIIGLKNYYPHLDEIRGDLVKEHYLDLDLINGMYQKSDMSSEEGIKTLFNAGAVYNYQQSAVPGGEIHDAPPEALSITTMSLESIKGYDNNAAWTTTVMGLGMNSCSQESRTLDMHFKVYLKVKDFGPGLDASPVEIKQDITPEPVPDPEVSTIFSNGGSSSNGSIKQGLNSVYSKYGNSKLPFDSIYLTGDNLNQFISAGGGILTNGLGGLDDAGIFPNSATMFIETIRADVEGSSMTIIEIVDFDATPTLEVSTKVYGYILDSGGNQTKPSFVGYVTSRKRRLSGARSEIVYECKDLIHFLSQFYTQSHYIYRPPSYEGQGTAKNYDRIIKEILNVAGIPTAIINIPEIVAPPVRWIYQTVRTVLEWATKYFGKYVYFVDRYGRLNFKATDSGSFIKNFTIPTKGDPIGSNRVSDFNPITDFSRSRSQVALTGDFPIKQHEILSRYSVGGELHPDNCRSTGIHWFKETIDGKVHKFYYFKFIPNQTLNNKLLSDPNISAKVTVIKGGAFEANTELSIRSFKSEPGDSEIYIEDDRLKGQVTLKLEFATRGDSPIQVVEQTDYFGGTEIIRRPEFKLAESLSENINDTHLMVQYLDKIKDFYKPVYGGSLTLEYLDTDLELLGKINIQNTNLSSIESDNLICYSITYDIPNQRTTVELSNKVYGNLAFFDIIRETSRENSELRAKFGLIEEQELYYRK